MTRVPRRSRWAWLVPVIALVALPDSLRELGSGSHDRGLVWSLLISLAAGAFWYSRYPRTLAERLRLLATFNLALIAGVVMFALLVDGGRTSLWDVGPPVSYAALGVLTALVLAEHFHRVLDDRRQGRVRAEERQQLATQSAS